MRIVVDFDGSLFINKYPGVGAPVPGALNALKLLKNDGHEIVVWSCRANRKEGLPIERAAAVQGMREALDSFGVSYDEIDDGGEGKVIADVYVDDRGLGCPLTLFYGKRVVDWSVAYPMIQILTVEGNKTK